MKIQTWKKESQATDPSLQSQYMESATECMHAVHNAANLLVPLHWPKFLLKCKKAPITCTHINTILTATIKANLGYLVAPLIFLLHFYQTCASSRDKSNFLCPS